MNSIKGSFIKKSPAAFLVFLLFLNTFTPVFAAEEPKSSLVQESSGDDPASKDTGDKTTDPADPKTPPPGTPPGDPGDKEKKELPPDDAETPGTSNTPPPAVQSANPIAEYHPERQPVSSQLKAQADEQSGALKYSFPITIPPGRNGMQPDLSLNYNSQDSDLQSLMGYGWSLALPFIERVNKKGLENLFTSTDFRSSSSGDLKPITVDPATGFGDYGARFEYGDFLKYTYLNTNAWEVKDKKGTTYTYGPSASSRQDDAANISRVFKWMLSGIRDTNGNSVRYEYFKDQGEIYPSRIVYTNTAAGDGPFAVSFRREARADAPILFNKGFGVKTGYRINRIETTVSGQWVHRYDLAYTPGDNGFRSMLQGVTESARNGQGQIVTLPASTFTYRRNTTGGWAETITEFAQFPSGFAFCLAGSPDMTSTDLVDLNGDSLADLVRAKYVGGNPPWSYQTYLNKGDNTGWQLDPNWASPITFDNSGWDNGVRLMDADGNGLIDFIQKNDSTQNAFFRNASGWQQNSGYVPPTGFVSSGYISDAGVRIGDVNGNGLPDLVRAVRCSSGVPGCYQVFTDQPGGTGWSLNSAYPSPNHLYFSDNGRPVTTRQMVDINGDSLSDLLYSEYAWGADIKELYLNHGKDLGWIQDSAYTIPVTFNANVDDGGVRFMDVNGDGLIDITRGKDHGGGYYLDVYLNKGDGTGWQLVSYRLPAPYANGSGEDQGLRSGDINGDSLPDFISAQGIWNGTLRHTYLNTSTPHVDLMERIESATGAITNITYKKTAQYRDGTGLLSPRLPMNLSVVDRITVDDRNGVLSTDTYTYRGGEYYFASPTDRRFAGFAQVDHADSLGNLTKTFFHQGNGSNTAQGENVDHGSKIGQWYRQEQYDSQSRLLHATLSQWSHTSLPGTDRFRVTLDRQTDLFRNTSGAQRSTAKTYTYDSYGNVRTVIDYGEVTAQNDGSFSDLGTDRKDVEFQYASNTAAYLVGLPQSKEVTSPFPFPFNGPRITLERYYYDQLSLGQVTTGNLTSREEWLDGSRFGQTDRFITKQTNTYNSYGLVRTTADARSNTITFTYDPYNLYPQTQTNALNQVTTFVYDYATGQPTRITDPNQSVTENQYDGLGRLTQVRVSDPQSPRTLVTQKTIRYNDAIFPRQIHTTDSLDSTIAVESYAYLDGLGRVIQTKQEAQGTDWTTTGQTYDTRGNVSKVIQPYFRGTSSYQGFTGTEPGTVLTYDALSRVLTATNSVGVTTNSYDNISGPVSGGGGPLWTKSVTDANGHIKHFFYDARGNLTMVIENDSGIPYATIYTYDLLGNLTRIQDARLSIRDFSYDSLGNLRTQTDTHLPTETGSLWAYDYDDTGNRTFKTDPRGILLNYQYDSLNRMTQVNKVTRQNPLTLSRLETMTYDSCTNGVGRLCSGATATGVITTTNYGYDILGRTTQETKIIDRSTYATRYLYDLQGNLKTLTYPGGQQAIYGFDSAGKVISVNYNGQGIASNIVYTPVGQMTTMQLGNGYYITDTYDPNELWRLRSKNVSSRPGGMGASMQYLSYTYYPVGNMRTITGSTPGPSSALLNNRLFTYTYDDLDRLRTVTAIVQAPFTSLYSHTYTYDALGNITSTTPGGTYTYAPRTPQNPANPHAVTSTGLGLGSKSFLYDPAGNVTAMSTLTRIAPPMYSTLTLRWDDLNRLQSTQQSQGDLTTYYYDHTGDRMLKIVTPPTPPPAPRPKPGTPVPPRRMPERTLTPTRYTEIEGVTPKTTNHVYLGDLLLASVEHIDPLMPPNTFYIHTDHLQSTHVITDSRGNWMEILDYFPHGSIRLDSKAANYARNQKQKFTGYPLDSNGLYFAKARYYNADIGRFMSVDPVVMSEGKSGKKLQDLLGDPQALNGYAYGRNNPVRFVDREGEFAEEYMKWLSDSQYSTASFFRDVESYSIQNGTTVTQQLGAVLSGMIGDIYEHMGKTVDPNSSLKERAVSGTMVMLDVATSGESGVAKKTITKTIETLKNSDRAVKTVKDISGFSSHSIDQIINRGIKPQYIKDAIQNTEKYVKRIDNLGRESFRYVGEKAVINFNEAKKVVTGWLKKGSK